MEKIGLIAGSRKFPLVLSEAARKKNYYIVAIAIKGDTSPSLKDSVDKIYWLALSEFRRIFEIFKKEGVTKVIMAGQISPYRLFSKEIEKDKDLKSLLTGLKDKKADTIFGAIAEKLKEGGLELLDSTVFIKDLLPKKGALTKSGPDFSTCDGHPARIYGLNLVGLRRDKFSKDLIEQLNRAFKILFNSGLSIKHSLEKIEKEIEKTSQVLYLVNFIKNSQRGIVHSCRK